MIGIQVGPRIRSNLMQGRINLRTVLGWFLVSSPTTVVCLTSFLGSFRFVYTLNTFRSYCVMTVMYSSKRLK